MAPLSTVVRLSERTGAAVINDFNLFRSAKSTGGAAMPASTGQALQEMQRIAGDTLLGGLRLRLGGPSAEESKPASQAASLFGLIALVYLVLWLHSTSRGAADYRLPGRSARRCWAR